MFSFCRVIYANNFMTYFVIKRKKMGVYYVMLLFEFPNGDKNPDTTKSYQTL